MLIYPETPAPQYPLNWSIQFKTIINNSEAGTEQRRRQWRFPKKSVSLSYDVLQRWDLDKLWEFYVRRHGSLGVFLFIEPDISPYNEYIDEFVGYGDGSTLAFNLPSNNATNVTMYINGVNVNASNPFTITSGSGGGTGVEFGTSAVLFTDAEVAWTTATASGTGVDVVEFTTPPPLGAIITSDFTGRIAMNSRFAKDKLDKKMFQYVLYSIGIPIVEVKKA